MTNINAKILFLVLGVIYGQNPDWNDWNSGARVVLWKTRATYLKGPFLWFECEETFCVVYALQ